MIGSASRGFTGCVQSGSRDEMLHFQPLSQLCELNVVFWTVQGSGASLALRRLEVDMEFCTVLHSLSLISSHCWLSLQGWWWLNVAFLRDQCLDPLGQIHKAIDRLLRQKICENSTKNSTCEARSACVAQKPLWITTANANCTVI